MELCSWLYRTTVFFLVCVLFHLVCNLQVLRIQDFAQVFQVDSDVGSQFTSLLVTLKATSELNIYKAGELLMCSLTLVTGLCILLRSATKITHKAQSVTCLASKWHVCATLDSFDVNDGETPRTPAIHVRQSFPNVGTDGESESEDVGEEEDDLDNNKLIPAYAYSTISYQKRHAL
ncbi:hypothetical protein Goarm_010422, partial [Gossypium armourianum]|nr:hypothetical protein [Gossypium armourianum]